MTVEHDPMCPCFYKDTQALPNWQERCVCDLLTDARAQEREKAARRVSEIFWPTDGSWVSEETTFDAMGKAAIAAARGEAS